MSDLINRPDATRLIFGLRDTGYSFNTAAADIIDNCLAANATSVNVQIDLHQDGRKFVYFGDDGDGMTRDGLLAAMKYGAPARENPESLGKFGLGLKTASSSVCLRYTVISRCSKTEPLNKLSWDLEHVEQVDAWEMLEEPITDDDTEMFNELCGESGTLVIWSNCDRILSKAYDEPGGTREQQAVKRLVESLRAHVALIYHRFLSSSKISISINGEPVEGWNPFYPKRSEQVLPDDQQKLEIELADGSVESALIKAWILPHRDDMSREEEKKYAKISNVRQGFYIHRENRLIQEGGWLGVFGAPEPHTSLLRIEFDFGWKLDDAFKVDVKKSKITFDPALEEALTDILRPIYREANNRYRKKTKAAASKKGVDHGGSNKAIDRTKNPKTSSVTNADANENTGVVNNNRGAAIKLKARVENNVSPENIHVEAVTDITDGELWKPSLSSTGVDHHVTAVRINKHHDFYQKIYQRSVGNGYAIEGMDILLWAFAQAEVNNTNKELEPIFEDIREEISTNLKKVLRDVPVPEGDELDDTDSDG